MSISLSETSAASRALGVQDILVGRATATENVWNYPFIDALAGLRTSGLSLANIDGEPRVVFGSNAASHSFYLQLLATSPTASGNIGVWSYNSSNSVTRVQYLPYSLVTNDTLFTNLITLPAFMTEHIASIGIRLAPTSAGNIVVDLVTFETI